VFENGYRKIWDWAYFEELQGNMKGTLLFDVCGIRAVTLDDHLKI
jgi:hypothetical protein